MSGTRLYLLDVEGTVAPISLVYEKMFPYARAHLSAYLAGHWDEVATDLELLLVENRAETDARAPRMDAGAEPIEYLLWLMDVDRKSTALKSLQGKVWKAGFESGAVTGEVFADVPGALERWSRRGLVAIYSSGSVEAQRLFFRYSSAGDLTGRIAGYFDTRTGAKGDAESYRRIAAAMGVAPGDVLFFSDVVRELDAAREAGCGTRLVVREGNAAIADARGHEGAESCAQIESAG